MKNNILLIFTLISLAINTQAQDLSKNAIGLRLGSNDGFGSEISYQRAIKNDKRLEFDLGWRSSRDVGVIKLAGLHQWVWDIDNGFNWYAGVGGGFGTWRFDKKGFDKNSGTILFIAGDLGIEYNFDIPLQVSLDMRPELYFNSSNYRNDNFGPDIAFGVRYKFD
jgi:hypothetical protein